MRLIKLNGIGRVHGLHFTPDGGELLVVGGSNANLHDHARWVSVADARETRRVSVFAPCYAVRPDLSVMAAGSAFGLPPGTHVPPVVTFDPSDPSWHEDASRWRATGMTLLEREADTRVSSLAFDPVGERLAVSLFYQHNENGAYIALHYLQVAPVIAGAEPVLVGRTRSPALLTFSPDGTVLAGVGGANSFSTVYTWDADTLDLRHTFTPPGNYPRQPVFAPAGDLLAVPNAREVYLLPTGSDFPRFTLSHPKQANAAAFTPDGRRLLSTCHDGLLRIWDVDSGQLMTSFDWGIGPTTAVAVSPDGLTAAIAGQKGQIAVFDLE